MVETKKKNQAIMEAIKALLSIISSLLCSHQARACVSSSHLPLQHNNAFRPLARG